MSGLNIIGSLTGTVGTVIAANAVIEALYLGGVPMAGLDLAIDRHGRIPLTPPPIPLVERFEDLPYEHTLFLDVMPAVQRIYFEHGAALAKHRTAMVFYFELDIVPQSWCPVLANFDVCFAASHFVKDAIERSAQKSTHLIPVTPFVTRPYRMRQARTGPFRVLYSFDPLSDEQRKNPMAAIYAFANAFYGRADAELIVKVWRTHKHEVNAATLEAISSYHPGIKVLHEDLPYDECLALTESADCYLSLHRGEGLGLGMLEAMALGTPVVATDFGGCTDFVDASCGIPVAYTLVQPEVGPYNIFHPSNMHAQPHWAEANIEYAAQALQRLADAPDLVRQLSIHARAKYVERQQRFLSLEWIEPLLQRPQARTQTFTLPSPKNNAAAVEVQRPRSALI